MNKRSLTELTGILRGWRLALHLFYGILLAVIYPHLNATKQHRILKTWSRQLLTILNIGIQIEGHQPSRSEGGCLIVANHVSWLDIIVLNAIYPVHFIAKAEVRNWPVIGWLCRRSGTLFIERAFRKDAAKTNQSVSLLLMRGGVIGLFPEGTTTDGKQVGHFHSSLMQPAINTEMPLRPIALRYQNHAGRLETAAAFVGEMTLAQSIWKILCCPNFNALVAFTPALQTTNTNRRELARSAQQAITHALQTIGTAGTTIPQQTAPDFSQTMLSSQSCYALLVVESIKRRK